MRKRAGRENEIGENQIGEGLGHQPRRCKVHGSSKVARFEIHMLYNNGKRQGKDKAPRETV